MPISTRTRPNHSRALWLTLAAVCLWCGLIVGCGLFFWGCGPSGHARSGGTEIGSTINNPDKVDFKATITGRDPTPAEIREWINAGYMKRETKP